MSIGCFIANLFSTVGLIDTVVGTAATVISVVLIYVCRNRLNLFAVSLFPVLFNAVFVGAELKFVANLPFFASAAGVALGEFVCVSVLGVVLIKALSKNKRFMKLIMAGHNVDSLS